MEPSNRKARVAVRARALVLCGLVAALAASAAQARNFSLLHNFHGTDGSEPQSLVADTGGNLYGTTLYGGDLNLENHRGYGTVFKIAAGGGLSILHVFKGREQGDGGLPYAVPILDEAGNLYGTTDWGGRGHRCSGGCGTVFELQ